MLRLMNRKTDENETSFLEDIADILWSIFKRIGEIIVKIIKKIISAIWNF